jgi:hypothetical protein
MYKVLKLKLSTIISNNYDLKEFSPKKLQNYLIMQQDNSIFRHINKINNCNKLIGIKKKHEYIEDIIFVNINKSVTMAEWQIQKKKEEYQRKYLEMDLSIKGLHIGDLENLVLWLVMLQ